MIQRKQTVYLLLSSVLMLLLPFLDSFSVITSDNVYNLNSLGFYNSSLGVENLNQPTWGLFGLNVAVILLPLITIFLYKLRVLQMRLTIFSLLLKIGLLALGAFYIYMFKEAHPKTVSMYATPWIVLPVISIVFDALAHRGIAIDERLIQYLNSGRLR